jgi:hypothetical protein
MDLWYELALRELEIRLEAEEASLVPAEEPDEEQD